MAAQRGKDLILKVRTETKDEFVTVAGLRTKRISFNSHTIDITDSDSADRWRELLGGTSVQRASISGQGVFRDQRSDSLIRQYFFQTFLPEWKMHIPDFGTIQGIFQITSLEYSGNYDGEMGFQISLESAGVVNFGSS